MTVLSLPERTKRPDRFKRGRGLQEIPLLFLCYRIKFLC